MRFVMRRAITALLVLSALACGPHTPPIGTRATVVYKTATGRKYHKDGCRYLSKSKISITLGDAVDDGLEPCKVCDPPVLKKG